LRDIVYELTTAIAASDWRLVDRLADEFREFGRLTPMCPTPPKVELTTAELIKLIAKT